MVRYERSRNNDRNSHENYGSTKELWERICKRQEQVELNKETKELKALADFFLPAIM